MEQASTSSRLPPSSRSSCCCGRDDCHARARWQDDIDELKNDARAVADIAQELLKENEQHVKTLETLNAKIDAYKSYTHELTLSLELAAKTCRRLDQQLSEKSTQLQQVEARFERVNAKNKDLKHELKTKSAKVRDMQLFVQDTVCESVTREEVLREKLKAAEGKDFKHVLKTKSAGVRDKQNKIGEASARKVELHGKLKAAEDKDLKQDLKTKSAEVRDMQNTIGEDADREAMLRGKLKAAEDKDSKHDLKTKSAELKAAEIKLIASEDKLRVAEHKLEVAEKIIAKGKQINQNPGKQYAVCTTLDGFEADQVIIPRKAASTNTNEALLHRNPKTAETFFQSNPKVCSSTQPHPLSNVIHKPHPPSTVIQDKHPHPPFMQQQPPPEQWIPNNSHLDDFPPPFTLPKKFAMPFPFP
ncbi:predicted protein [Lichtheimia corymbifera JMRC:FSU:9682]|uniref:Uncharacterized protein n=1 Tax=Lichtheimia corymbifera JMRC:FSU:9682 TaxID=1263082 RepID=A0A068RVH3_9FUNG|nr:predicted protein [Lichtheimia corymbifera JMRC:FSU:9682]